MGACGFFQWLILFSNAFPPAFHSSLTGIAHLQSDKTTTRVCKKDENENEGKPDLDFIENKQKINDVKQRSRIPLISAMFFLFWSFMFFLLLDKDFFLSICTVTAAHWLEKFFFKKGVKQLSLYSLWLITVTLRKPSNLSYTFDLNFIPMSSRKPCI